MKKTNLAILLFLLMSIQLIAQQTKLKGIVYDANTLEPIPKVLVKIINSDVQTETNELGIFQIEVSAEGTFELQFLVDGYFLKQQSIIIEKEKEPQLESIYLIPEIENYTDTSIISLSEDDLLDDGDRSSDYIAGLFQSSRDAYLKAAAFNFSQAWFKVRGYDSSYGQIAINGIEMNKIYDGRPQWSNWGGLNDAFRNQEFTNGLAPSYSSFGNILGTTNFSTRASDYRAGGRFSMASTNKSYTGRLMATYATGFLENNWAFVASGSRRIAEEGYIDGTPYNAWSVFLAAEKKLNKNNSINITAIAAPNKRGKSSPNTQEVYNLKGTKYNPYWGLQEGDIRNSRTKEIVEPIVMLSHYYENANSSLKTTLSYQFGTIKNSRLGYFNAPNPDPTYWRYLPSAFLRYQDNLDYASAYLAAEELKSNGQINWEQLYQINAQTQNAAYYLYDDVVGDSQIAFNSVYNKYLKKGINFSAGISYTNLLSKNYAEMNDLLGATGFVDLDQYAEGNAQQNDLNNPNRNIAVGDEFQYKYNIQAATANAFAQIQASTNKLDYFASLQLKNTNYQRNGLYKNGTYALTSFGKSEKQSFTDFSAKAGLTYKLTGRHLIALNGGYLSNAPTIRNSFSNSRVTNAITPNLSSEKITTVDINYIFRSPKLQARLTAFYTNFEDAIETSFFFAEGILGDQADFVNEIIAGVNKLNIGTELSLEYQATPTITLLGAGSFGQYTYNNNPQLYLQSESISETDSNFGTAYLKNYRVSGTPQRAYSFGFSYRDPNYWWFQANANLLTNNYLDISPLLRTDNFYLDADGIPFIDDETGTQVTQEQIDALLVQEKFKDAFFIDVVGGKSWRVKNKYVGFFAGINNVLGEVYKTGGFEQSRKANYPEVKEDKKLANPIFAPKYWYASNTSYYLNVYVRF